MVEHKYNCKMFIDVISTIWNKFRIRYSRSDCGVEIQYSTIQPLVKCAYVMVNKVKGCIVRAVLLQ